MTGRDLRWRLMGVGLLACAGGASFVHRAVLDSAAAGPATGLEVGLALASFVLACLGITFLIQGVRLRDDWAGARSFQQLDRRRLQRLPSRAKRRRR